MKEKILRLLKTKGYYLVLALCVLTVGTISFLSYRASQQEESKKPLEPSTQNVEKVEENVPADETEHPAEQPAAQQPAPNPAPAVYQAPLEGEQIGHFSPDQPVYSYTLKDWRTHCGIDIAAEEGTQVLNVCEGVVESVAQDDLMGNLVTVRHTDGKRSRYASLATVTVEEGQLLALGDPVGTVGKTMLLECGETHHLHYELWEDDKVLDPAFLWKNDDVE